MMVSGMFSLLLYVTDFPLCIYIYKYCFCTLWGGGGGVTSTLILLLLLKLPIKKLACLFMNSFFRCGGHLPHPQVCVYAHV